jgi:hypothetical protein
MQDRSEVAIEEPPASNAARKWSCRVVGDLAIGEVMEFGAAEVVDREDVGLAALVNALTMFEPINPAAPVTTMYMVVRSGKSSSGWIRQCQLADHDARRPVRQFHGFRKTRSGGKHHAKHRYHRVAGSAHIVHFARHGRHVQPRALAVERHAFFAARHQQGFDAEVVAQFLRPRGQIVLVPSVPPPAPSGSASAASHRDSGA